MFFPVRRSGFRSWRKMSTFVAKKLSVMLKTILFIGAGSFVGGVARYLLSRAVQSGVSSPFPWGPMAVNVAGCLLIGILYGRFEKDDGSEGENGERHEAVVQKTSGPAVFQGAHNTDKSIRSFAHACFTYALATKQDLWFSTKDTIAKIYDGKFKAVFEEVFTEYEAKFKEAGITYFYTLIDDAVARVIRSEGGFIWACKNYDGDVMSDMVSTAFGSLAMMTSVLVAPDGTTEYEAAHGTVTKHYYKWKAGEKTSTNPMATIFAWSGALRKRAQLDGLADLEAFANRLEAACFATLNAGIMTKDLVGLVEPGFTATAVDSETFLDEIAKRI